MKLSIIIPTYNKAEHLDTLLHSLARQEFSPAEFELIIVNDGSTDHTEAVIVRHKGQFKHFRALYQKNQGVGSARNTGIDLARGELIAFLADDYILSSAYCARMVAVLADPAVLGVRPDMGSVGSSAVEHIQLNRLRLMLWTGIHDEWPPLSAPPMALPLPQTATRMKRVCVWAGAAMMRRSLFARYGKFRTDLETGEDMEFALRLAADGIRMHFLPITLVHVSFRQGVLANLKRDYQYMANDQLIRADENHAVRHVSDEQPDSMPVRVFMSTVISLCMADSVWRLVQMLPYVVLSKCAQTIAWLRYRS